MANKIKTEELVAYLFDDKPHNLKGSMRSWIDSSRHYKEFAHAYRDKIRKKIRITNSDSAVQDLLAELTVAYQLVQQKKFTVVYEAYGSEQGRGPDFSVTFKSQTFNIEVTRIDSSHMEVRGEPPGYDPGQVNGRIMDTVCDKLGQMRPGMSNVLLIVADSNFYATLDLERAMVDLKDRVEGKDEGLYGRYRFEKPADFFKYYLLLSGILVYTNDEQNKSIHSDKWTNNQAKHALPNAIWNILQIFNG